MDKSALFSKYNIESYREGKRLEVKSAKGGLPNSLWETYSAFANSDGGVILLGVRERKDGSFSFEGLVNAVKLEKDFWNIINNRQKISTNILTDSMVKIENIDGRDILIIRVPRAERTTRPVYVGMDPRLGSYRRNGEGDYHCSVDEVSLMLRDASPMTEDFKLLTKLDYSVFCPDTIKSYRNIFRLIHDDHLWNKEDDEIFMRRIGAVRQDKDTGKFHPTAAGLLMFGYEYEILEEFPQYFLDYQENRTDGIYCRWDDRITSQTGDWSGNVFDFILKVIPRLQSDFKVPFVFKGNQTVKDTPLHKVVREAMVNMLTNADFYGRRGVVVQKNSDGFRFANPGNMRVSLNEAVHDNISDPRNGVMLKMLALVEYGERAGSGLQGIFTTWEKVYHIIPEIEIAMSGVDRTTLILKYNGNHPDIHAMKLMYDDPDGIIIRDFVQYDNDKEGMEIHDSGAEEYLSLTKFPESGMENIRSGIECSIENNKSGIESGIDNNKSGIESNKSGIDVLMSSTEFKTVSSEMKIKMLLGVDNSLTIVKMAHLLDMSKSGVQKITDKLRAEGRLFREGSTKAGRWILK